jgi:hypothetical protein
MPLSAPQGGGGAIDVIALITASAALLTAVVGVVTLISGRQRFRLQLGMENMWRLIESWDGADMRHLRSRTARSVLDDWSSRQTLSEDGQDVLNVFELLAYLVIRAKTLSIEDVWINFSGWALYWWFTWEPPIAKLRNIDRTVYEDYAALIEELIEYEAGARNISNDQVIPTDDSLRRFLAAEYRLRERFLAREQPVTAGGLRSALTRWLRG